MLGVTKDGGNESGEEDVARKGEFEELAEKYEELKGKVEQYFENEQNQREKRKVPVVSAPQKPTQEQWERHQATHTHHMSHGVNTA